MKRNSLRNKPTPTAPAFKVRDLIDDQLYDWSIGRNYLRLAPGQRMAHVMRVERP